MPQIISFKCFHEYIICPKKTFMKKLILKSVSKSDKKIIILLAKKDFSCTIPSLTVVGTKNRYNHCIYWFVAIFFFVTKFSIFLSSFTFFLNIFHLTFGYKLIVCSKITGIMKGICNFGSFIGWNKSLFLNFSEV